MFIEIWIWKSSISNILE